MVVEDNPGDVDLVRAALGDTVTVEHVDRISALAEWRRRGGRSDVVLLDLSLPDAFGIEALEQVRAVADNLPVVVLTGCSDASLGDEAVHLGAEDYLMKGDVTGPSLQRALRYAVERHRSRERDRLLFAEQAARTEAERSNHAKDRFLAVLSHELRNPLTPIRYSLEIMCRAGDDLAMQRKACEVIQRQMRSFIRLVDDLLDVAHVTQNKIVLRKCPIPIRALVNAAIETVSQPGSAGHQISVSTPAQEVLVDVDPVRMGQVLSNLLSNAVKFTPSGGRICVEVRHGPAETLIAVRDNGVGFGPEAARRIFEMFHQEQRTGNGLGIGLALAKRLVEMHGGTLQAASDGEGCGAEFTVRLPPSEGMPREATPHGHALGQFGESQLKVLVVDDNSDAADTLALLLDALGHTSQVHYDAESALAAASDFRPQVALLDIGLPGMDGYELADHLRNLFGNIHLVAISGLSGDEISRRAREVGFHRHLVKPADPEVLKTILSGINTAVRAQH